jgi:hypothetical protein
VSVSVVCVALQQYVDESSDIYVVYQHLAEGEILVVTLTGCGGVCHHVTGPTAKTTRAAIAAIVRNLQLT